jgi:hypothetical protein
MSDMNNYGAYNNVSKQIYKFDRFSNESKKDKSINLTNEKTNENEKNKIEIKSGEYYGENFTKNKNYFFTLLNHIKTTYIEFNTNPTDEIEKIFYGYISQVNSFHVGDKKLYNEFKKENANLNKLIEDLTVSQEKKNVILANLEKEYKNLTASGNAFQEHYNDSIYDYSYSIVFATSIMGLSGLMIYLTQK